MNISNQTEKAQQPQGPRPSTLDFFFKLAEIWDLSTDQQIKLLGSPGRSTYFRWRKDGGDVSADTLERISHLGSADKALGILLDSPEAAVRWICPAKPVLRGGICPRHHAHRQSERHHQGTTVRRCPARRLSLAYPQISVDGQYRRLISIEMADHR